MPNKDKDLEQLQNMKHNQVININWFEEAGK